MIANVDTIVASLQPQQQDAAAASTTQQPSLEQLHDYYRLLKSMTFSTEVPEFSNITEEQWKQMCPSLPDVAAEQLAQPSVPNTPLPPTPATGTPMSAMTIDQMFPDITSAPAPIDLDPMQIDSTEQLLAPAPSALKPLSVFDVIETELPQEAPIAAAAEVQPHHSVEDQPAAEVVVQQEQPLRTEMNAPVVAETAAATAPETIPAAPVVIDIEDFIEPETAVATKQEVIPAVVPAPAFAPVPEVAPMQVEEATSVAPAQQTEVVATLVSEPEAAPAATEPVEFPQTKGGKKRSRMQMEQSEEEPPAPSAATTPAESPASPVVVKPENVVAAPTSTTKPAKKRRTVRAEDSEEFVPFIADVPEYFDKDKRKMMRQILDNCLKKIRTERGSYIFNTTDGLANVKDYHKIVKKPLAFDDLEKEIEDGTIKTVIQLWRAVMLLFQNADMFNAKETQYNILAERVRSSARKYLQQAMIQEILYFHPFAAPALDLHSMSLEALAKICMDAENKQS